MRKSSNKEMGKVIREARKRGWSLENAAGGHMALRRDGHRITVGASPSDRNAPKHTALKLRRCEREACGHVKRGEQA